LGREGRGLQSFEIDVDLQSPRHGLQSLTHTRFGWLDLKIAYGRDEGRRSKGESSETELTVVKMGIYTLKVRILRARSGVSGKPGISGKISGVFTPPESSDKICKEFDFG
jgi:hypothetical protein